MKIIINAAAGETIIEDGELAGNLDRVMGQLDSGDVDALGQTFRKGVKHAMDTPFGIQLARRVHRGAEDVDA